MGTRQQMPCQWVDQRLEEWLEGDLPPADAQAVQQHLDSCPGCAEALALAREIAHELHALPALDAPPRVLEAVREQAPRNRWALWSDLAWWPRSPAALAATLLAVLGLLLLLPSGPRDDEPDPEAVARATAEARFALAYVGSVTRRTGQSLRHDHLEPWVLTPLAATLAPEARTEHRRKEI